MKIFVFLLTLILLPSALLAQSKTTARSENRLEDMSAFGCKTRLPNNINSYRPTIQPVLTPDGRRLYFDRKYHPFNIGSTRDCDDIWYSDRQADGTWSEPVNIGAPLNTRGCDVLFSISPDGKSALVGGVYADTPDGEKVPGFSVTTWNGSAWTKPVPIVIPNFYNTSGYFYASLSSDNAVLLFALARKDVLGELDLYFSLKDAAGKWTEPVSLGPTVNSIGMEVSPFLALDGKTLYFSSSRKGGYGASDLYVTRRLDDTWLSWSKPQNLGPSINTFADELSISINAAGDTACIVSADSINQLEGIYFVCLPKDVRPQTVNLEQYIKENNRDTPETYQLYFETGESRITDSMRTLITQIATKISGRKNIIVTGYTDDTGSDHLNMTLSKKRAQSVAKLLHASGIRAKQIQWDGEKSIRGREVNSGERWKFRRVDISVP
ncbi:MAG: OmpA family protein [Candidatus Kapaibacterium sp.]